MQYLCAEISNSFMALCHTAHMYSCIHKTDQEMQQLISHNPTVQLASKSSLIVSCTWEQVLFYYDTCLTFTVNMCVSMCVADVRPWVHLPDLWGRWTDTTAGDFLLKEVNRWFPSRRGEQVISNSKWTGGLYNSSRLNSWMWTGEQVNRWSLIANDILLQKVNRWSLASAGEQVILTTGDFLHV